MLHTSPSVAAGDYAANIGSNAVDVTVKLPDGSSIPENGVFRAIFGVQFAEIADGLSNTLLIGEKHVPRSGIAEAPWDCGIYDGHNPDCNTRAAGPLFPLAVSDDDPAWKFGSWHPGICQFVFCDGSVRVMFNSIDPVVFGLLAQRNDGQPVTDY